MESSEQRLFDATLDPGTHVSRTITLPSWANAFGVTIERWHFDDATLEVIGRMWPHIDGVRCGAMDVIVAGRRTDPRPGQRQIWRQVRWSFGRFIGDSDVKKFDPCETFSLELEVFERARFVVHADFWDEL